MIAEIEMLNGQYKSGDKVFSLGQTLAQLRKDEFISNPPTMPPDIKGLTEANEEALKSDLISLPSRNWPETTGPPADAPAPPPAPPGQDPAAGSSRGSWPATPVGDFMSPVCTSPPVVCTMELLCVQCQRFRRFAVKSAISMCTMSFRCVQLSSDV